MAATWNRINTVLLLLVLLALLGVFGMLASRARGGPLDPLNAPAPTDSVKLPGTPISSGPYTIAAAGHYYLTGNIVVSGAVSAITINASDVSLDLGGFTIDGNDTMGTYGVAITGTRSNISIENGTIRDFHLGIGAADDSHVSIDRVTAISNIRGFEPGDHGVLTNCVATNNTETGIFVVNTVNYVSIRECVVNANSSDGITVAATESLIEGSWVYANAGVDIRVTSCCNVLRDNTVSDIRLESTTNWLVDNVCFVGDIVDVASGNYAPLSGTAHDNAC